MKPGIITIDSKNYPESLKNIHSPPKKLYVLGEMPEPGQWVAIVGSRRATSYGRDVASDIAGKLAGKGVVIVSGLAQGIDTIAHQAAVDAGGNTVAVLGGGFNQLYPANNRHLAEKIVKGHGAVISEYPPDIPPLRQHFPARNRIIAGLSQVTVVVEAALSSGSLITATFALEEGRDVMAVPGNINQPASMGCNNLIKAGALPLTSVVDIEQVLGLSSEVSQKRLPVDEFEGRLFAKIQSGIAESDELLSGLSCDIATLSRGLTSLEINGYIRSVGAGKWTAE